MIDFIFSTLEILPAGPGKADDNVFADYSGLKGMPFRIPGGQNAVTSFFSL